MRAALLLGKDLWVPRWQYEALEVAIKSGLVVSLTAHCQNDMRSKLRIRHSLYYLVAWLGRRNMSALRRMDLKNLIPDSTCSIRFNSVWSGIWQEIPAEAAVELSEVDVVIRFGMNLIKNPESVEARLGILSYHHGEISRFRGRPSGFYELLSKENVMGVTVQELNDKLDAGKVRASAFSRIIPFSYAKTLNLAFKSGVPLLARALYQSEAAPSKASEALGPLTFLPKNRKMIKFIYLIFRARVARIFYGLFIYKKWRVAHLSKSLNFSGDICLDADDLSALPVPNNWVFVADPAGQFDGSLLCEGVVKGNNNGQIVRFKNGSWSVLEFGLKGVHASYPQIVRDDDETYLFPEIAQGYSPTLFSLDSDFGVSEKMRLEGLEKHRLVDATLFKHDNAWFLFGSLRESAQDQLDLWTAPNIFGPWTLHSESPIAIDPRGSRMGGPIVVRDGSLYRFGQDCAERYGGALSIYEITELSGKRYAEKYVGKITIGGLCGPHTLLLAEPGGAYIDYYSEVFSLLAWWYRVPQQIKNRLKRG